MFQRTFINESGVQLLTAQKPIKRPGWWKGTFGLFWMQVCVLGGRWIPVQRLTPPPLTMGGQELLQRGLHVETVQSALTVILKLVIGGLTSVILIVLGTINLQFQGWFVPISRDQFSELWQLMSRLQSRHYIVFYLVGVSIPIRQLTGYGSEYYL